ncbi:MAG: hypothetical protein ABFS41_19100 [Myxococcota bacterium]
MRLVLIPLLALATLTGCVSLRAKIPEEAVRLHIEHEHGVELAASCSHEGKRFSEGAVACMVGQRMTCGPDGRWVAGGDC